MREFAICLIPIPQQPSQQEAVRKKPDGLTHFDLVGSECPAAAHHEAQKAEQDEEGARRLWNDDEDAVGGKGAGVPSETAQTQVRQVQVTNNPPRGESSAKSESTGETTPIEQIEYLAKTVGHRAIFKNMNLAAGTQRESASNVDGVVIAGG